MRKIVQVTPADNWWFYYFNSPKCSGCPAHLRVIAWVIVSDGKGNRPDAIVADGGMLSLAGDFHWPADFIHDSEKAEYQAHYKKGKK